MNLQAQNSLRSYFDDVNRLYKEQGDQTAILQRTLLEQILPNVLDDSISPIDESIIEHAKEWLSDGGTSSPLDGHHVLY